MDDMNETGRKMTTSDRVVASTASPMSAVASLAASIAFIRFSSTKRKMFSRTTMASSITTPTIRTSASIVTLLSVKSSAFIMAKVEMTEAGMAMPAMSVERDGRHAVEAREAALLLRPVLDAAHVAQVDARAVDGGDGQVVELARVRV